MSETLPGGLRAKTGYLPAAEQSGTDDVLEYRHYAELGDGPEISMEDAVDSLRQAFDDPCLFTDPRFNDFRKYVKSFYPQTIFDENGLSAATRLIPSIVRFPIDIEGLEADPGPSRELLGQQLTLYDVMGFTNYLLSNTTLEGPEDPRLIWLEELRGDREPPH